MTDSRIAKTDEWNDDSNYALVFCFRDFFERLFDCLFDAQLQYSPLLLYESSSLQSQSEHVVDVDEYFTVDEYSKTITIFLSILKKSELQA